jgi:hypothetical protein
MKLSGANDVNNELTDKAVPPPMSPMTPTGAIGGLLFIEGFLCDFSDLSGLAKCGRMTNCDKLISL